MRRARRLLLGLLVTAWLVAPAGAVFVETPLRLTTTVDSHVEVGQEVPMVVDAANASAQAQFAGQRVRVEWRLAGDEASQPRGIVQAALVLDDKAHASTSFTVPAEAADENIFVQLAKAGEDLANLHLRVGEAAPMAFAADGTGREGPPAGAPGPGKPTEVSRQDTADTGGAKATPGGGALVTVLALAGIAAVLVAVRPKR